MKKIFLIIPFFLLITAVKSQEVWTLEKCVEYALSNNIQVKQQLLQVKSESALLQQDKLSLLPSLNGGASHGYNFGQTLSLIHIDVYKRQLQKHIRLVLNFRWPMSLLSAFPHGCC